MPIIVLLYLFSTKATECGTVVRDAGQVITSPGYPIAYNNSEDCSVGILSTTGCIEVIFTYLDIASNRDCEQDYVHVSWVKGRIFS